MLLKNIALCVRYSVLVVSMAMAMSASVKMRLRDGDAGGSAEQKEGSLHVKKTKQANTQVETVRRSLSEDWR
jgi:hypothetical protein